MKHEQEGPVSHHLSLQDVRILNLSHFLLLPWFLRIDHRKYLVIIKNMVYILNLDLTVFIIPHKNIEKIDTGKDFLKN
jgi:hypothetical protein